MLLCHGLAMTISLVMMFADPCASREQTATVDKESDSQRIVRPTQSELDADINKTMSDLFHANPLLESDDQSHSVENATKAVRSCQDTTDHSEGLKKDKSEQMKAVSKCG